MPSLESFSLLLSIGVLGIAILGIGVALVYFLIPTFRNKLYQLPYELYLKLIGIIAISSSLAALTYQFYYHLPVCELCWWQRIFLFPINIIVFLALVYRIAAVHLMTGILATIGLLFAIFHYYPHFQVFVLGKSVNASCAVFGLLPGCEGAPVVIFKFITLPFMGVVVFLTIMGLSFLCHRSNHQ